MKYIVAFLCLIWSLKGLGLPLPQAHWSSQSIFKEKEIRQKINLDAKKLDRIEIKKSERAPASDGIEIETIPVYLEVPGEDLPSFASEFNSHLMSDEIFEYMDKRYSSPDKKYAHRLRNFFYFNGYYATTQDARGSQLLGLDPQRETELRQEMAESLRSYMISKGLPSFLRSLEGTKHIGKTYDEIQESSQVKLKLNQQAGDRKKKAKDPWQLQMGPHFGSRYLFANFYNKRWSFTVRESVLFEGGVELWDLRVGVSHRIKQTTLSTIYYHHLNRQDLSYGYKFNPYLSTKAVLSFYRKENNWMDSSRQSISLNYLF